MIMTESKWAYEEYKIQIKKLSSNEMKLIKSNLFTLSAHAPAENQTSIIS